VGRVCDYWICHYGCIKGNFYEFGFSGD